MIEEHVKLVRVVLETLREAQLYAKLSKCDFHKTRLDYLEYQILQNGMEMDPEKVRAILEWEVEESQTRKQLQSFLGFANFYRQFIPTFVQIALPITNLHKGVTKPDPVKP